MAVSVSMEFDDDDDNEEGLEENELQNEFGDTSFDPESFSDEELASGTQPENVLPDDGSVEEFDPAKNQKTLTPEELVDRELKKSLNETRKQLKEAQAEQKRELKELLADQARANKSRQRELKQASQANVSRLRADAAAMRIQAYSISAALGFPGYIGASFVDQLLIRPQEQEQVDQQKQYQEQLFQHYQQVEDDRIQFRRQREQEIRELPIEAVDLTKLREKQGIVESGKDQTPAINVNVTLPEQTSSRDVEPPTVETTTTSAPVDSTNPNYEPERTVADNSPPVQNVEPTTVPPVPPIPPTASGTGRGGSGSGGGGGSGNTPNGGAGRQPIGGPPPVSGFGGLATILAQGVTIGGVIRGLETLNSAIDKTADSITRTARSIVLDTPSKAAMNVAETTKSLADPFGVNPGITVAVSGFELLLTLTEAIKESAERDSAFAPKALEASITGSMDKLVQQIILAQRLDPTYAAIVQAQNQFDMAWNELKATFLESIGPAILFELKAITAFLKLLDNAIDTTIGILENDLFQFFNPAIGAIVTLLKTLVSNTMKDVDKLDASDIQGQIADFLNPQSYRVPMPRPNRGNF